jgi:endonuclease/exonuclease/phosphatase (EEP) superfamily protein YafD
MLRAVKWATIGSGLTVMAGTLASSSRSPHWGARMWDYPRVQIGSLAAISGAAYGALFSRGRFRDFAFLGGTALSALIQFRKIYVYTPLAPVQVRATSERDDSNRLRLLISNVQMENAHHDRVLAVIREQDPDVVLLVETDHRWAQALETLAPRYGHLVRQPQDNYYGLLLLSRYPLEDARVKFLVQDDIPSVHATVVLPSGTRVALHGLHPRPPQPNRDQHTTPRDAELVLVGRAIGEGQRRPTVVIGDLNDVAWSHTSELFMRLSGLLDPRIGRGFYNSFDANKPILRWPLDHVFHSADFRLVELRRLEHVGSDHFPVLVELSYEPEAAAVQPNPEKRDGDVEESNAKLEKQAHAARRGDDRPGRS